MWIQTCVIKLKNRILIWPTNHQNSWRLGGERVLHSAGGRKKSKTWEKAQECTEPVPEIISNLYYHTAAIWSTIAASLLLTRDKPPQICILGWAPSPALRQRRPSKAFSGCVLHLNCQSVLLIKWISGLQGGGVRRRRTRRRRRWQRRRGGEVTDRFRLPGPDRMRVAVISTGRLSLVDAAPTALVVLMKMMIHIIPPKAFFLSPGA